MRAGLCVALIAAACGGKRDEPPDPSEPPSKRSLDPSVPPSNKLPPTEGSAAKPPREVTSPLPEKGPHPDYPTPMAAGTDKLFLIEEPDRGPEAPLDVPYPSAEGGTPHAYCELGPTAIACTAARPDKRGIWYTVAKTKHSTVVTQRRGNLVESARVYLTKDGKLAQVIKFDRYRRLESALLFSTPTRYTKRMRNGRNGLHGCGAMEVDVDKHGRAVASRCLQWSGAPMRDTAGVASTKVIRDARGIITDEYRYGLAGEPIAATDLVHHRKFELDAVGRTAVERWFGVDDRPTADNKGCHGYRYTRDVRGLVTRTTCIGADGKPSNDSRTAAWREFGYDSRGCQTSMRNVAIGGKQPRDPGVDYVVDERCAVLSHTCVSGKGDRVACAIGDPARYDYKLDDFGQRISIASYQPDGTAGKDPAWNAFELRHEYDARGNAIVTSCYDAFGKPTTCERLGFARRKSEYDHAGRETSRVFFDVDGNPATNTGAFTRKFIYDNYDHVFESRGYDRAGNLLHTLGSAVRRDLYDAAHRRFAVVLLDKAGKPARYTGCYGGTTCPKEWHAVRIVRKPDGIVDKNQFFDHEGQLVATMDCGKVRCFR